MKRPGVDDFLTFKKEPHRGVCVHRSANNYKVHFPLLGSSPKHVLDY